MLPRGRAVTRQLIKLMTAALFLHVELFIFELLASHSHCRHFCIMRKAIVTCVGSLILQANLTPFETSKKGVITAGQLGNKYKMIWITGTVDPD